MKAVRIDVHGHLAEVELPGDGSVVFLHVVRRLVGASTVERLTLTSGYEIWLDEDGIAKELPLNPAATELANHHGLTATIPGTVVVTRIDPGTGAATPATPADLSATYEEAHPASLAGAGSAFRTDELCDAVRLYSDGYLCLQAAAELLIAQDWLRRTDFTRRFITCHQSLSDSRLLAIIDWQSLTTSLDAGTFRCSAGEKRMLRLTASLAAGTSVDLAETLTGIDHNNAQLVAKAVLQAAG